VMQQRLNRAAFVALQLPHAVTCLGSPSSALSAQLDKMVVRYLPRCDDRVLRSDDLDPRRVALKSVDDVVLLTELDSLRGDLLQ
jgi:hypothetical protein